MRHSWLWMLYDAVIVVGGAALAMLIGLVWELPRILVAAWKRQRERTS